MSTLITILSAHKVAVEKGQILHRDISAGNIIITRDGRGLLIDWDLCCRMHSPHSPRRHERTVRIAPTSHLLYPHASRGSGLQGTWQFMSIALLNRTTGVQHGVPHDLESFLWLLLYLMLRYRPAPKWTKTRVQRVLKGLFDDFTFQSTGLRSGGAAKKSFLVDDLVEGHNISEIIPDFPTAVSTTVTSLRSLFRDFHANITSAAESPLILELRRQAQATATTLLSDHEKVMGIILIGIKDASWDNPSDSAEDQIADLIKEIATEHVTAQLESVLSRFHQPSASGTSKASSGSKRKETSDEFDDEVQRPQKRRKSSASSRLASSTT